MFGLYIGTDRILAVAIPFHIIHTLIIWSNILISITLASGKAKKNQIVTEKPVNFLIPRK